MKFISKILTCFSLGFLSLASIQAQEICVSFGEECCGFPFEYPNRYWFEAEDLNWWLKDCSEPVPVLISSQNPNPILGQPGTRVVLGGKDIYVPGRQGVRFAIGAWMDCALRYGGEVSYFSINKQNKKPKVTSSGDEGSAYLSVPFFDVVTDSENSSPIAIPGLFGKTASLKLRNSLQGVELNALAKLEGLPFFDNSFSECINLTAVAGFRWWSLNERLLFTTALPITATASTLTSAIPYITTDRFHAYSNFYGAQIGLQGTYYFWSNLYRC